LIVDRLVVAAAARRVEVARDAPVDQRGLAALAEDDVVRRAVAVHDAALVRVREGLGDRDQVRQQLEALARPGLPVAGLGVRQLVEPVAQRDPVDALEHAERPADARLAELVDRDDRRVLQLREDPRLGADPPLEQLAHARRQVVALARRLEDHRAAEPLVLAEEDLRHAAARDRIGRPPERVLADQALREIERDRRADHVVRRDHGLAHRAAREVLAHVLGMRLGLELRERRMLLARERELGRVRLHALGYIAARRAAQVLGTARVRGESSTTGDIRRVAHHAGSGAWHDMSAPPRDVACPKTRNGGDPRRSRRSLTRASVA